MGKGGRHGDLSNYVFFKLCKVFYDGGEVPTHIHWRECIACNFLDCKTVRIFAYSSTREQSNKRSGMRLKTESETGARKTLTPRFTDFFTDFEKKTDCFAV